MVWSEDKITIVKSLPRFLLIVAKPLGAVVAPLELKLACTVLGQRGLLTVHAYIVLIV